MNEIDFSGWQCFYCEKGVSGRNGDHIICNHLIKGIFNQPRVPSCRRCNNILGSQEELIFDDLLMFGVSNKNNLTHTSFSGKIKKRLDKIKSDDCKILILDGYIWPTFSISIYEKINNKNYNMSIKEIMKEVFYKKMVCGLRWWIENTVNGVFSIEKAKRNKNKSYRDYYEKNNSTIKVFGLNNQEVKKIIKKKSIKNIGFIKNIENKSMKIYYYPNQITANNIQWHFLIFNSFFWLLIFIIILPFSL